MTTPTHTPTPTPTLTHHPEISLLIINPNSTPTMTAALHPAIDSLAYPGVNYTYMTAPSGPASINDADDLHASTMHTLPHLLPLLPHHDGFLLACYSAHPLVGQLKRRTSKPVVGIFEASVMASLLLLGSSVESESVLGGEGDVQGKGKEKGAGPQFGIVSTGKAWEELLGNGVRDLLGGRGSARFAGVETTGLSAGELHLVREEEVWGRVRQATGRLVRRGDVRVVCLGCAGMVGMEEVVREGVRDVGGVDGQGGVRVVDGVRAGVGMLVALVRGGF